MCLYPEKREKVFRCGLVGEVLARSAPSYMGLLAALFHNKDKGFKAMNNLPFKKI